MPGFQEDDAASDFDGVIAEPFVELAEQGDVDSSLYSVRSLRDLGDGEQAPVHFVHDRVGGDKLFRAFSVDVPKCQLRFGGTDRCGSSHVLYDWPRFGWDCRCGVTQAGDLGYMGSQSAHTLQTCGDVKPAYAESQVMRDGGRIRWPQRGQCRFRNLRRDWIIPGKCSMR